MEQLRRLIPEDFRWGALKLAALVPVRAILDLAGVAALLPVMMLVVDSDRLRGSFLERWCDALGFSSQHDFALFVIVLVMLVLLVRIALCLLITSYQNRFLMGLYRELSSRLFVSLYSRGLLYIKNQNSSRMTFNVISVCYNFVMGYLGGWMRLCGEVVFVLLMFAALMVYSPIATLMALCAFAPVIILYMLMVRKPLRRYARKENDMRREQHRLISEAFKGYSEVQVNDVFPAVKRRFDEGLDNISSYRIKSAIISSLPSYMMEFAVVSVVAVMLLVNFSTMTAENILFLGVFTVALLKLMPAIRTIVGSVSALSATEYTKEVISDIETPAVFNLEHNEDVDPMPFEKEISVNGVSFIFPDDETAVLDNVSLTIRKGEHLGIKGRTGSGKTTLFNILLGLYPPTGGSVCVDGRELSRGNVASWHRIVGYVPQDVFVADGSILENVALGMDAAAVDRQKVMDALAQASLDEFVNALPEGLDTRIGEAGCKLSGGQRQRLGIARALFKDAKVLFFDEATSALDAQTEQEINTAIEALGRNRSELTIIVISHRDSTMSFCDRIFEL